MEILEKRTNDFYQALSLLDLEPIIYKLVHNDEGQPWTIDRADKAASLYRNFLELCYLYPEKQIVPTIEIDKVWHAHILDTRKYSDDCMMLFGKFLHHFPYFGLRGAEDQEKFLTSFNETKELFLKHFYISTTAAPSACGDSDDQGALCEPQTCDSGSCSPAVGVSNATRPRLNRAIINNFAAN